MKKLAALLLSLALVFTVAMPVLAEETTPDESIPEQDVIASGPESVALGDVIAVTIHVTSDNHGISALLADTGLELLARVGGQISEDPQPRFLLEPGEDAVLFYRVTGAEGSEAIVAVHDVHVFEDGTDRMGNSRDWEAEIGYLAPGAELSTGPLRYRNLQILFPDITEGRAK